MTLSRTFQRFFDSEKSSGFVLILCTLVSLALANSAAGAVYVGWWHTQVMGLTVQHWINDALMVVFFLLVGLELERELYTGELSQLSKALLPIVAAIGGVTVPAIIHFGFNAGSPTQPGTGIPMATDIAFALAILALVGSRVPVSLKVFLAALAVMDDLAAIIVIAVFYSTDLSAVYLAGALLVFAGLVALNRYGRVMSLAPYLVGGALMWFLFLKSGVHATIAGVLLAFAIPFSARAEDEASPSHRLEHMLHYPVAFAVLPTFALANTALVMSPAWEELVLTSNSAGIILGLVLGKPVGITAFAALAVFSGVCRLPEDVNWRHIVGAGMLGGIGFTMSIFIANLAFPGNEEVIDASKMAILVASTVAAILGFLWLRIAAGRVEP
jgi:Na+:H+ antiporter, NhaA family